MELNFDKEMDALLRQAAQQSGTVQPPPAETHLDADEMAAFSAGALPAAARSRAMKHLVDCGTCRTVMSNLIFFENQDQEEAEKARGVAVAAPVVKEVSLLDKIFGVFSMPALAYGMAGLVLVFTGALVFVVFQNSNNNTLVSQANTAPMEKSVLSKSAESSDKVAEPAPSIDNANAMANAASAANTAISGAFTPSAGSGLSSSGPTGSAANSNSVMRQPFSGGVPAEAEDRDAAPKSEADDDVKSAAPPAAAPMVTKPAMPRQDDSMSRPQVLEQQPVTRSNDNQQRNQRNIMMPDGSDKDRTRNVQVEAGATLKTDADGADREEKARDAKAKESAPATGGSKGDSKKAAEKPKKKATPTPTPTPKPEEERREEELPANNS